MNAVPQTGATPIDSHRTVILAPTFNHAVLLGQFLPGLDICEQPCIAIDDGSTDATPAVLAAWVNALPARRTLITHMQNRGKAAALQLGFSKARELGFTHALTIDTDGQHDPRDVAALLAASRREPEALVIGARDARTPGYPWRSRFGRAVSNALVWLESGQIVRDSQSGMRIYPLEVIARAAPAKGWAPRYGFETQVLTVLGLQGVGCCDVPIRCIYQPRDIALSHFRVFTDSSRALVMHAKLLLRAHAWGRSPRVRGPAVLGTIPRRLIWWFAPMRVLHMARGDAQNRRAFAASVGWGAFMAISPLYGIKTLLCLWLARRFSLHPLVVIAVSSLSSPPMGFFTIAASIMLGHMLLHGTGNDAAHWSSLLSTVRTDTGTLLTRLHDLLMEWLVGGFVGAIVVGLVAYMLTHRLLLTSPAKNAQSITNITRLRNHDSSGPR